METKEIIQSILNKRRTTYLADPTLIVQDYNGEKKMVAEYNGRQLLEMLQNANDACITDHEKVCYIELTDDTLIIANNGKGFTKRGIEALTYIDISEKQDDDETIGAKGLGFRSILSWASSVIIKSNNTAFEFSRENSKEFLDELIKAKPEIADELKEKSPKEPYPIATLRCPKLKNLKDEYNDYDTYIIIKLKDYFDIQIIEKQIEEELNLEVLLFLNHLKVIKVSSPSFNFCLSKKAKGSSVTVIQSDLTSGDVIEQREWKVLKDTGDIENKKYELKVAWTSELQNDMGVLYSYFKTEVELDFPCLVHGTFDLTADRNHFVTESTYNKELAGKLVTLLIKAAQIIAEKEVSYRPLKILDIDERNVDVFWKNCGFIDTLRDEIKKSKIFPSIADKYISLNDNPKYLFKRDYSGLLPAEKFSNLLKYTDDEGIISFLKKLEVCEYNWPDFFKELTSNAKKFPLDDRITLLQYIYEDCSKINDLKERPDLFLDEKNNVIPFYKNKFRLPNKEHILPLDTSITIVSPDIVEKLDDTCLNWYHVKEYTINIAYEVLKKNYLQKINSCKDSVEDQKRIVLDFLQVLYRIYDSEHRSVLEKEDNNNISVINRNGKIVTIANVYFGKEYDCELCEKLFEFNQDYFIASPEVLKIEKDTALYFLKCLGVAEEPRREQISNVEMQYVDYAVRNFPYKRKKLYDKYGSFEDVPHFYSDDNSAEIIKDLDHIISNNSAEDILTWLYLSDYKETETNANSTIKLDIYRQRNYCIIKCSDMPSYLFWKISNKDWMNTKSGVKVKPTQCCISKSLPVDFSPFIEIPKIDYQSETFKKNGISKQIIDDVLKKIGVKTSISDFDSEELYYILSCMPEKDPDGIFAPELYRQIASNYDVNKIEENYYKNSNYQFNKVFCRKGDETNYVSIDEASYIPKEKKYPKDIVRSFWIIDIPNRFSAEKIEKLFKVVSIPAINTRIEDFSLHNLHDDINKCLESLKPVFYAFFVEKDENDTYLKKFRNLKINICQELLALYDYWDNPQKNFIVESMEYIFFDNQYYVKLNHEEDWKGMRFSTVIAQIICEAIENKTYQDSFSRIFENHQKPDDIDYILEEKGFSKENVKSARERMEISDNPKIIFWSDVLAAKGNNSLNYRVIKDNELTNIVQSVLKVDVNDFEIQYDDIKNPKNIEALSRLFTSIDLSLSKFNKHTSSKLKFDSYYKKKLDSLRKEYKDNFVQCLFDEVYKLSEKEQELFFERASMYDDFSIPIENEVIPDVQHFFFKKISEEFGFNLEHSEKLSMQELFEKKKKELREDVETQYTLDSDLLDDIINTDSLRSLVIFGKYDRIKQQYSKELKSRQESIDKNVKEDTFNLKSIYRKVRKEKTLHVETQPTNNIKVTNSSIKQQSHKTSENTLVKSTGNTTNKNESGVGGESLVYDYLKEQYGKNNVSWDSNYAKEVDENIEGRDLNHYDIRYKNEKEEWVYVEVKTNQTDTKEFGITKSEYEFGLDHKEHYEIFHIRNFNSDKPVLEILKPFETDFFNNDKFTAIPDGYIIKYEIGDKL